MQLVQRALRSWGCEVFKRDPLPRFGADGVFGTETDEAVRAFQRGQVKVDGIVGPATLARLDQFVGAPQPQHGPPTTPDPGGPTTPPPAASISTSALKARISSVDMKLPKNVSVTRQRSSGGFQEVTLTRSFSFDAVAHLKPGPELDGLKFGFFQLGRPFESWRVTYRRVGVPENATGQDFNRDETSALRGQLPALDHSSVFYADTSEKTSASDTQVKVSFFDYPRSIFEEIIVAPQTAQLSGVFVQSFFFTAFGVVTPSGQALLLKTFYWTVDYCEKIARSAFAGPGHLEPVTIVGPFDCLKGNCVTSEPGADKFGTSGSKSLNQIAESVLPPYGGGTASGKDPVGPGDFALSCGK